jgi:hypothetical protein
MNEDRLIELMRELFEKMGSSSMDKFNKEIEDTTKGLSAEEAQRKKNEIIQKRVNEEFDKFDKSLKSGRKKLVDLGPTLDRLEEQFEEMGESIEKTEIEQRKNVLASQYLTAQYKKSAGELSASIGKVFVGSLAKTAGGLVRSLQGNASGAALAGELLTNTIDFAQSSFSTVAKAGATLGSTLAMSANPQLSKFGIATATASVALEGITSSLSELAKFGVQVMVKEVEKTVKAFNEVSAAGAIFAGGMTGVREAAFDTGLTVEQFSNVIKTNAVALGQTGLNVTEAAKRIGGVGKVIKISKIEEGLMKLGFGFEEQAGLIADTMASMRRSGVLGTATDAQIAQATENYAKNLRVIAEITGKDAAAAMKEAQAKNAQYAFESKVRENIKAMGLNPEQAAEYRTAIDNVTSTMIAAGADITTFQQRFVTGTSTIAEDYQTGMTEFADIAIRELNERGNRNGAAILDIAGKNIVSAAKEISYGLGQEITTTSLMGRGSMPEYDKAFESMRNLGIMLESGAQNAMAKVDAAAKDNSKATNDLINAEINAQSLRIQQEAILTAQLGDFAEVIKGILKSLKETVEKYMGQYKEKSILDDVVHVLKTSGVGLAGGAVSGATIGGIGGIGAGPAGMAAGATAGALTYGTVGLIGGASKGIYDVIQGNYAVGGIVHRPELAMIGEGGNSEAVVPLPDNRSIPVKMTGNSMDTKEMVSAIQQQSGILNQILTTMEKNNQLTSGILQTSY